MKLLCEIPTSSKNSSELLPLECEHCGEIFYRQKKFVLSTLKLTPNEKAYCSSKCQHLALSAAGSTKVSCAFCGNSLVKLNCEIKGSKSGNSFCNQSCSAKFNNRNKTCGTKRSKLEVWIDEQLRINYPEVVFIPSCQTIVDTELDFYFPDLFLAIEINGIHHSQPIFGQEKLDKVQYWDALKLAQCKEKGIDLLVIDTAWMKRFTVNHAQPVWDRITDKLSLYFSRI